MTVAAASDVITETVQFLSDGFTIYASLARQTQAARPQPGVMILHEWWGVNDHMKDIAQRIAREGYVALVPDLYSRQGHAVTKDPAEAARLMEALSSQATLRDLNAATRFFKALPFVDPLALGAIGFCMGGTLALTVATHNSDIKAAAIFYGKVPPVESFRYLLCPILYHHGAKDGWVTKQEVDRLRQGLQDLGKPGEVISYPNADHAFFNDTRPEVYQKADAALAWKRTLEFFANRLR